MTIACPQCAAPAAFSAEPTAHAGRMMRCARCGTTWLARLHADDPFAPQAGVRRTLTALQRGRPRFERVIEHVTPGFAASAATSDQGFARRGNAERPPVRRPPSAAGHGLVAWSSAAAAIVLGALVAAIAFNFPEADASAGGGTGKFGGLDIRMLRSAVEPVHNGHAVAVEGEIANRSGDVQAVPAVRVSLLANGVELYTWTVEPTTTQLAAGGTVLFRSVLAAPPAGIDEVAFRLAERRDIVVGMY